MKFVVTGCGRSGTTYVAGLLSSLDGDEFKCSHEKTFEINRLKARPLSRGAIFQDRLIPLGFRVEPPTWGKIPGDSSWLAVPYLAKLSVDIPVFHQVRHPLKVVRSICRLPFLGPKETEFSLFAYHFAPEIEAGATHAARALRYWVRWNQMAEELGERFGGNYLRYNIEDLDVDIVERIFSLVGVSGSREKAIDQLAAHPRDVNTRGNKSRDDALTWASLPDDRWKERAEAMAARYGYAL